MKFIDGGVCAAKGFTAGGIHCGIRKNKTKRDLALIADEQLTCAEIEDVLMHSCKYVTAAKLFDVYRGGQVPEGKKSMAFTLTFTPDNNVEKAFTPETLDGYVKKILNNLKFKLGVELR